VIGEPLRILVYEHVSGGGFAGEPIPSSVLSEGFAMLRVAVSDFKSAGHSVTALLDSRVAAFSLPIEADHTIPISSPDEAELVVKSVAEEADAVLVIAPESNNVLQSFVETVESTQAVSLNCTAGAIEKVTDKSAFCERVKQLGLRVPETMPLNAGDSVEEIKRALRDKMAFPLVFKPVDGTSCSGLSIVRNWGQVAAAVKKIFYESSCPQFMVQEFISGVDASVSLIATGDKALPVSLNKQNVVLGTPDSTSSYEGGFVPFDDPISDEAFGAAEKIVSSFNGLVGYVGVDMVLSKDKPVVIEVNPRLTTSIVGLRRVANFNLAQAVLDATVKRILPKNVQCKGYAFFSKVAVPNPAASAFQDACRMDEVVSPPFPVAQDGLAHALVQAYGHTPKEAALRFREAKKHLQHISQGGK
jgi:predicted ATP-grasp superfamily ATP-dependent carboligase